jgi:hypothetical protein
MNRRPFFGQSMIILISAYLSINKKLFSSVYDKKLNKYILAFVVSCTSKPESGNMTTKNQDHCSIISERKQ